MVEIQSKIASAEEVELLVQVQKLRDENKRLKESTRFPGNTWEAAGKWFGVCDACGSLVRLDKPIFGSLHICVP